MQKVLNNTTSIDRQTITGSRDPLGTPLPEVLADLDQVTRISDTCLKGDACGGIS